MMTCLGGVRRPRPWVRLFAMLGTVCSLAVAAGCASSRPDDQLRYFPAPPAAPRVVHLQSFNSLDRLARPRVSLLERLRGGVASPFVETPAGLDCRDGHLYICDSSRSVVHDWDLATGRGRLIGASGAKRLQVPVDVAVDATGHVYVADTGRGEVVICSPDGSCNTSLEPEGEERAGYRPVAVAVRDHALYVADVEAHAVDRFDTAAGTALGRLSGADDKPFYYPVGVAATADGLLAVSEMLNTRVQLFDLGDGMGEPAPRASFGEAGDRYGDLGKPKHVAVGDGGLVFVADAEFAHVHIFDQEGRLLMLFGGPADEPGGTPMPLGVAVASHVPENVQQLVPAGFDVTHFVFVTSSVGQNRLSLFAVGQAR